MKFLLLLPFIFQMAFAEEAHHGHHGHHEVLEAHESHFEDSLYGIEGIWYDSTGKPIRLADMAGKPHLFAMLYTRCQTACPILVEDVRNVHAALPAQYKDLDIVLFSIDAETETNESLGEFRTQRKLGPNWKVLRANATDVATLAAVLGFNYKRLPDGEYVHSNSVYFVSAKGELVSQQDGLNKVDQKFVTDIKASLSGSPAKKGIWRRLKNLFSKD